jgi:hypothetical protein
VPSANPFLPDPPSVLTVRAVWSDLPYTMVAPVCRIRPQTLYFRTHRRTRPSRLSRRR